MGDVYRRGSGVVNVEGVSASSLVIPRRLVFGEVREALRVILAGRWTWANYHLWAFMAALGWFPCLTLMLVGGSVWAVAVGWATSIG